MVKRQPLGNQAYVELVREAVCENLATLDTESSVTEVLLISLPGPAVAIVRALRHQG